jgi:four helix bundle protein
MHRFKELKVWEKSMDIAVDVYKLTSRFPKEELFGLASQVKRSAVSMPSNIAEGAGRNSEGEFVHFLGMANGSACELETQLLIAARLGFVPEAAINELTERINDVQNMTFGLQKKLKHKNLKSKQEQS